MALQHDATPRLTPEQRDRVLDLAARLQAQHESGIHVDDLAQAAAEAGIDARFVHQAVRSVVQTPPALPVTRPIPAPDRNVACILLGVLTLLNALLSLTRIVEATGPLPTAMILLLLLAAVTGHWSVRSRLPVWLVPATLIMTLLTTQTFQEVLGRGGYDRHREVAMMMIVAQAILALLVGGITRLVYLLRSSGSTPTMR